VGLRGCAPAGAGSGGVDRRHLHGVASDGDALATSGLGGGAGPRGVADPGLRMPVGETLRPRRGGLAGPAVRWGRVARGGAGGAPTSGGPAGAADRPRAAAPGPAPPLGPAPRAQAGAGAAPGRPAQRLLPAGAVAGGAGPGAGALARADPPARQGAGGPGGAGSPLDALGRRGSLDLPGRVASGHPAGPADPLRPGPRWAAAPPCPSAGYPPALQASAPRVPGHGLSQLSS